MLNIIDEYTRECLKIRVGPSLKTEDVQDCLTELFCARGVSVHLRSDNGSAFANRAIRTWLGRTVTSRASTASCATSG